MGFPYQIKDEYFLDESISRYVAELALNRPRPSGSSLETKKLINENRELRSQLEKLTQKYNELFEETREC